MLTIDSLTEDRQPLLLANGVRIRQRFLRSVNLERDFYLDDPLDGYIPTEGAITAFERISVGIRQPAYRAFTITGPYGTGKSAFALFAARALSATRTGANPVRQRVREQAKNVSANLFAGDREGYWPILITGSREPIGTALVRGLMQALRSLDYPEATSVLVALQVSFESATSGNGATARDVVQIFAEACRLARAADPTCMGLLVVVDELGKLLEYGATHPAQSDMQVLQELAEYAARSREHPILLLTILHQAFEEYVHRLGAQQRAEWQKVQGRFGDIPFGDAPEVALTLMAGAIEQLHPGIQDVARSQAQLHFRRCEELHLRPGTLTTGEFLPILEQTFPLHPLSLLVMPHLFRRFGQSERSLFTFLAGDEPFGFQEFLRAHTVDGGVVPQFGLDALYDYVLATMGSAVYVHSTGKLWSETAEALFRLRDSDPLLARTVKVIGLLSVLGEQTRILPSRDVLTFALTDADVSEAAVGEAVDTLKHSTIITYRKFKNAYRLYEGSDIDVDTRIRDGRAQFTQGVDPIKTAATLGGNPPVVARRHSYETGTLRFFEVRCCRSEDLETSILHGPELGHGLLLLCLCADARQLGAASSLAAALLPEQPQVIVGVTLETEALQEAAIAVETLLWVQKETPELRTDRVATREVRERLVDAQAAFEAEWDRLLRPHREVRSVTWFYGSGEQQIQSYRELQGLVSLACDRAYPQTPRLRNELINRRQLSSAAAAARRNLIDAMISRQGEFLLGIEGFPPERSMYESVLRKTGIHQPKFKSQSHWWFDCPCTERDPAMVAIWDAIEEFIFCEEAVDRSVAALNRLLRNPPYGVADGLIPILLCAVLLRNDTNVAIYEDGRFITDLDAATFERIIKRPNDFELRGYTVAGERQAILERFARGLLGEGEPATIVGVAKELFRQFSRLPEYTWKTRRLSSQALAMRELFKHAREPERLLLIDLPQTLGLRPFTSAADDVQTTDEFFSRWNNTARELLGAYRQLLQRIEDELLRGIAAQNWEDIRVRAAGLLSFVSDPQLKAFVVRAGDYQLQQGQWLESVAAGVAGKPPASWLDVDEQRFVTAIPKLVAAFRHAELVAFEKQKVATEDSVGLRVAITQESGAEDARVVLVPKAEAPKVEALTANVFSAVQEILMNEPEEVRLAVIGQVAQAMIRGENE